MNKFIIVVLVTTTALIVSIRADILVYDRFNSRIVREFRDLPARFGSPISPMGLKAFAVPSNPAHACEPIARPPNITLGDSKPDWVVVIERYNCSFEDKIRNAQMAGYTAAIVYNVQSNDLEEMSANNPNGINISAVFVGELTGRLILFNYIYFEGRDTFELIINDDLPFDINTHIILPFAIVVAFCFIIMVSFMVIKCVREQRRLQRYRLPKSVLKKIPIKKFVVGDAYDTCAICLDDYVEGDKLRVLPCAHAYHSKCIDPWLTKNRRVCPVCKRAVYSGNRRRRHSSDSLSEPDDRTPLLESGPTVGSGPNVSAGNANTHGTFPSIGQGTTVFVRRPDFLTRFLNLLSNRTSSRDEQATNQSNIVIVGVEEQQPPTQPVEFLIARLVSNNVLNPNHSGSFGNGGETQSTNDNDNDHDDDDDDDDTKTSRNNAARVARPRQAQLPSSSGRIGVAALPSTDFVGRPNRKARRPPNNSNIV